MIIYTDGSCLGNGKAVNSGGFGVVVLDNNENLLYNYSKSTVLSIREYSSPNVFVTYTIS